jgi:hypothetical protein
MNNTGEITDGTMEKLLTLRVMMPDGSSCRFSGQPSGHSASASERGISQPRWRWEGVQIRRIGRSPTCANQTKRRPSCRPQI